MRRSQAWRICHSHCIWNRRGQNIAPGTSAKLAELITLTRALQLGRGKRVNIYIDSKYASLVLHAHATIWKERGFLIAKDTPIKHGPWILSLIEAVHLPKEVAIIHWQGHQKGQDEIDQGNHREDQVAKSVILSKEKLMGALIPSLPDLPLPPLYNTEEKNWDIQRGNTLNTQGRYELVKVYTIHSPSSRNSLKDFMIPIILDWIICTKSARKCLLGNAYVRQPGMPYLY